MSNNKSFAFGMGLLAGVVGGIIAGVLLHQNRAKSQDVSLKKLRANSTKKILLRLQKLKNRRLKMLT